MPMKKQPTYWKKYNLLFKTFSSKSIYEEIRKVTYKLGKPFNKKSNRGPKFKIPPEEYVAYEAYQIVSNNASFRDMELDSDMFLSKHLDHGTFHNNFLKIPYSYLNKLLSAIKHMLEELLGKAIIHILDSTGLSTQIYEDKLVKGKITRRNKDYKLHTLTSYYPKEQITCIKDVVVSDKHISDAEGGKRLIKRNETGGYCIADRGYDAEKVYKEILKKNDIPIIKPKKVKAKGFTYKVKGRNLYKEHIYKELRGVVETGYGGLENKGLLDTRCIRDDSIKKKGLLAGLRHTLFSYLRACVINSLLLIRIIRQTLKNRKLYIFLTYYLNIGW